MNYWSTEKLKKTLRRFGQGTFFEPYSIQTWPWATARVMMFRSHKVLNRNREATQRWIFQASVRMAWIVIWLADGNFVSFRSCTMETPSRRLFPIYNHAYCFIDSDFQLVFVLGSSDSSVRGEPYRIFDIFFGRSASLGKCWSLDDDQSNEWIFWYVWHLQGRWKMGKQF